MTEPLPVVGAWGDDPVRSGVGGGGGRRGREGERKGG